MNLDDRDLGFGAGSAWVRLLAPSMRLPAAARLLVAPVATLIAWLVQYATMPQPTAAPFVFCFLAVALASWVGGRVPGLIAVALTAAMATLAFVAPANGGTLSRPQLAATLLYLVSATPIALLFAILRETLLRADEVHGRLRQLTELVDLSQDAIFVWQLGGSIESWNRGAERLYGFAAEDAVGHAPRELLRTIYSTPWPQLESELRRHEHWEGELIHRTRAGHAITVWSRWQLLRGPDGAERVLESTRDVTQRKRIEEERSRLIVQLDSERARMETILEQAPVGIAIADAKSGKLSFGNQRFHEIFGAEPGVLVRAAQPNAGLQVTRLDGTSLPPEQLPMARALRGEVIRSEELRLVSATRQSKTRVVSVNAAPIRTAAGTIVGSAIAIQDVTERKSVEAEREKLVQDLREADRRKDDFLAVLSHELRNPLTPVRNSLYLLRRGAGLDERSRHAVGVIDRQIAHLARLIDDLLDVTRITRGKIRLQRTQVDIVDLVRRVVEDYRPVSAASGVGVELTIHHLPLKVDGDAARLAQVVGNLLQNSVKFTPAGGKVSVSIARDDGGRAVVEVQDTGMGIDAATMPRLFQAFEQADRSLDRTRGGLGLGLALARALVEMHGGTIEAFSEGPDRGSRFIVRLPLAADQVVSLEHRPERPPRELVRMSDAASRIGRRSVLIVEDNRDAAESLREVLELAGHHVEVAFDGKEGVEKAREVQPDIVLCDIGLPGIDGYEVAQVLRKDPSLATACLVAVTGYAQPEDVARAQAAGFDGHVPKPPDLDVLGRVIAQCGGTLLPETASPAQRSASTGAISGRATAGTQRGRILLVDDEEGFRAGLASVLRQKGFEVFEARDGEECLALLQDGLSPDATLLDYRLPGISGAEVLERLRAKGLGGQVVLITGAAGAKEIASRHQFQHYLGKPFAADDVVHILLDLVRNKPRGADVTAQLPS